MSCLTFFLSSSSKKIHLFEIIQLHRQVGTQAISSIILQSPGFLSCSFFMLLLSKQSFQMSISTLQLHLSSELSKRALMKLKLWAGMPQQFQRARYQQVVESTQGMFEKKKDIHIIKRVSNNCPKQLYHKFYLISTKKDQICNASKMSKRTYYIRDWTIGIY